MVLEDLLRLAVDGQVQPPQAVDLGAVATDNINVPIGRGDVAV